MDRSLDEAISDRLREDSRGGRGRRQNNAPRDGIRKNQRNESQRNEPSSFDRDWVHDRFNDADYERDDRQSSRSYRVPRNARRHNEADLIAPGAKIRVDNLHYDLGEEDLRELFTRIGPVHSVQLLYDRQDRSRGIAYVTYHNLRHAEDAIAEFNNANANGQPIRLQLLATPTAPSRNPFDNAERPSRSLFDRIERRRSASPGDEGEGSRTRRGRRDGVRSSDAMNLAPENIDRYVPGQSDARRSPMRRNRDGNRSAGGRGPGQRRERERTGRPKKDDDGHVIVQGRPRKTQEELDAEMEDYWGGDADPNAASNGHDAAAHDDTDMIQ